MTKNVYTEFDECGFVNVLKRNFCDTTVHESSGVGRLDRLVRDVEVVEECLPFRVGSQRHVKVVRV